MAAMVGAESFRSSGEWTGRGVECGEASGVLERLGERPIYRRGEDLPRWHHRGHAAGAADACACA